MRILLITDWMREPGGAERYISVLRDGLIAAGEQVSLLTSTAGSAGDGLAEYRAASSEWLPAKALLQITNPFAIRAMRSALREFRPDVALINMIEYHLSPAILFQLGPVPAVLTVSDYKSICPVGSKLLPDGQLCRHRAGWVCCRSGCVSVLHWLRDQPRYALLRSGRKRLARILACSRWVQRELARNDVASEHLILPVPPPTAAFRRAPAPAPLFVYSGRFEKTKGLVLLLAAFARLRRTIPSARLRIVGDGHERPQLERLVEAAGLGVAVTFRGWVAPDLVEHETADAWAVVVPSLWAEPLGLVAVEAMVRGVPVIASEAGGLGETVEHGRSGLLFPNGDLDALVRCLEAVARGACFPSHTLEPDVVRRARERHCLSRHLTALRRILGEVAG